MNIKKFTPEKIEKLSKNEVFVFGSNVNKLINTFSNLIEIINQGEKNEKAGQNNVVKMVKAKVLI